MGRLVRVGMIVAVVLLVIASVAVAAELPDEEDEA